MAKRPTPDTESLINELKSAKQRHDDVFAFLEAFAGESHIDSGVAHTACDNFKKALSLGYAASAPCVAYFKAYGLACKKDMEKAALWIAIGAKLGDQDSLALMHGTRPDLTNLYVKGLWEVKDSLKFTPVVQDYAEVYAGEIRKTMQKISIDTPISLETLAWYNTQFEHAVLPNKPLHIPGDDSSQHLKPLGEHDDGCCCIVM